MRVGIVLTFMDPARTGGAETYVRELVDRLQIVNLRPDDEFVFFTPNGYRPELRNDAFSIVECSIDAANRYRRILWEQTRLPRILKSFELDLVHFPYGTVPMAYKGRGVVTIHDTLRFFFPEEISWANRNYKAIIESHIRRAEYHVISVSKFDGEVMEKQIGIRGDLISAVYHGVSPAFARPEKAAQTAPSTVLWIGRPYERKNLVTLIEAMSILKRSEHTTPNLRIVGVEKDYGDSLQRICLEKNVQDCVSLEPAIPHKRISSLFHQARIFVYPSTYESFGIPVLEALAAGVPTVCSDIPAFRELFGGAVAFAEPNLPQQFADCISKLLDNSDEYDRMVANGVKHAAAFTWDRCATETLAVYRKHLGQKDSA